MSDSDKSQHALQLAAQYREDIRHLQTIRLRLISIYFLILGGTGYIAHLALNSETGELSKLWASSIFWVVAGVVVSLLIALSYSFAARTAQYTDVIRIALNKAFLLDDFALTELNLNSQMPSHCEKIYSPQWRRSPLGWPVGLIVFPLMGSALGFSYAICLCSLHFEMLFNIAFLIAFIACVVVLGTNVFALGLLTPPSADSEPEAEVVRQHQLPPNDRIHLST